MPTVTAVLVAVVNLIFVADLLRMKLALTPSTSTTSSTATTTSITTTTLSSISTTTSSPPSSSPPSSSSSSSSSSSLSSVSNALMDTGGSRGTVHGLREVLRSSRTPAKGGAPMWTEDVSDDEDLTLGSGSGVYLPDLKTADTSPQARQVHILKDDRRGRPQSTCCFVGKWAASRQLHCLAQYHVDKLHMRSKSPDGTQHGTGSRLHPHSKHLPRHLTRDFRRCVLQRPLLFQKCCYGYATARSDRLRWYNYRKARTGSLQNSYNSWRYIYS